MKTRLTREESQHLIDLGVSKEKATGNYHIIIQSNYPIFTLTDLLEILPNEIVYVGCDSELSTSWNCIAKKWDVGYMYNMRFWAETMIDSEELIDALYKLTCWYYGEYLKKKKK